MNKKALTMKKSFRFIVVLTILATQSCNSDSRAPTAQDVICSERISRYFSEKGISTQVLISRISTQDINASYNDTSFNINEAYRFSDEKNNNWAVMFDCDFEGLNMTDFVVKSNAPYLSKK